MLKKSRQSNIEALRIFAMSVIILLHFFMHGSNVYGADIVSRGLVVSFLFWGVNAFVIISGYFGIRFRLTSFLKLYVLTICFVLVNIVSNYLVKPDFNLLSTGNVLRILFPFSKGGYWFMAAYCGLFFTAPLINNAVDRFSIPALRKVTLTFTLFNLISCGIAGNVCNSNGYTYFQFLDMYLVGQWLAKDHEAYRRCNSLPFALAAVGIGLLEFISFYITKTCNFHETSYFYKYNNLFVMLQSICIFVAFSKFQIGNIKLSGAVNICATAALGCYLLQDGLFGYSFLYDWQKSHWSFTNNLTIFCSIWITSFIVTYCFNKFMGGLIQKLSHKIPSLNFLLDK